MVISANDPVLEDLLSCEGVLGRLPLLLPPPAGGEPPLDDPIEPRRDVGRDEGREEGREPSAKIGGGCTMTSAGTPLVLSLLPALSSKARGGAKGELEMEEQEEGSDNFCSDGIEPESTEVLECANDRIEGWKAIK